MAKYLLTGIWFYSGVCLALDGFGAAWWHWPWVLATGACVVMLLANAHARANEDSARTRRSWRAGLRRLAAAFGPVAECPAYARQRLAGHRGVNLRRTGHAGRGLGHGQVF